MAPRKIEDGFHVQTNVPNLARKERPVNTAALAAREAAEGLREHAAGPDCFVSDRTAVMACAKGWDLFADALEALD